jgi:hypothetical protein
VLATSSLHRINAVNVMMITPATSDTMRMHHHHHYRHPATGIPGGAEEEVKAKKAEKKIVDAVMLYITVSNSHYYPIS